MEGLTAGGLRFLTLAMVCLVARKSTTRLNFFFFLFLFVCPATFLVIFPVLFKKRNPYSCSDLRKFSSIATWYSVLILLQWLLTFAESAKFLKARKISYCFLPGVDSTVRYLQLFLTHPVVILRPKSPTPSLSLMVSKSFLQWVLSISETICGKMLQKYNVSSWF